ncbi:M24 family metallopeptidase [Congregibacter brevis]|uniref:M24 family metallopeptidase n=1 Tax=Congregibacter brevis TaxID=3081201 RepID=A0ABZ0IC09_9GAMM|nr:M24 family metallopeptidase [Congregibacter sp. IMCC45268]
MTPLTILTEKLRTLTGVLPLAVALSLGTLSTLGSSPAHSQLISDPVMPDILDLEARAATVDRWLKERLDTLVQPLMRKEGVDMWILVAGEYDEDPVVKTMLPATWLAARRTTIMIFHDRGGNEGVERLAVARYPVADLFPSAWNPEEQGDQWERVAEVIRERNPATIAINTSEDYPLADGLSAGMRRKLERALGPLTEKLVENHNLAVGWLETRTEAEMAAYPTLVRIAHSIIAQMFSEATITPGITTTEDLRWHLRQHVSDLGLGTWFHPSVHVQRASQSAFSIANMSLDEGDIIMPGDFLHVDFGITYLRLNTDTQQHAYVLRPGETEAPKGLRDGLAAANKVQDALLASFKTGRSGNEMLAAARKAIEAQGIKGTIYTHPLGLHGHGAGPTIGMWDNQGPMPGARGTYALRPNTAWSIELNAEAAVPEWDGQLVRFMTEEDAFFDGKTVRYLDGRQTEITLIPRQK